MHEHWQSEKSCPEVQIGGQGIYGDVWRMRMQIPIS